MSTNARFPLFKRLLLTVAVVSLAAQSQGLRGQAPPAERRFSAGITGSAPGGPSNPSTMLRNPAVKALILKLADGPVEIEEANQHLKGAPYTVTAMVEAGLARRESTSVRLALNYLSASDQRAISARAPAYGRELAELILAHRESLERAIAPLASTADERRAVLYFLVGCMALDWDGLRFTQQAGYRAGATVTGPGYAYTPWMKENAPDIDRRGLYWGSHNLPAGSYTFTTFGDHAALPRMALPDLFFSIGNPFATLKTSDSVAVGSGVVRAYVGAMLADTAQVLVAVRAGARTPAAIATASSLPAPTVSSLLALLESLGYVENEAGGRAPRVTILDETARPAVDEVVSIVRDAVRAWHGGRIDEVRRDLSDLTAVRQGVPFDVVYTEVWHYVFGHANLFLSKGGFLTDPYAEGARFQGFVPVLWATSLDPDS